MQTSGSSVAGAPKAGFWIRFVASIIDSLVITIPGAVVLIIAISALGKNGTGVILLLYLLWLVASIGYFLYFWSQPAGQTLGLKALKLRVVKTDGSQLTFGAAVVRYLGYIVNSIIFGLPIGFIWAAFDANKQGWHDKMAGTYVVKSAAS